MRTPHGAHPQRMPCRDVRRIRPVVPAADCCPDCRRDGTGWRGLWLCLSCGWVACSGDSPARHAEAHYRETDHPIATALDDPDGSRWCFVHGRYV
ncbi:UBP-type zinc finger domain-containing protein [Nocardia thraciensis]